MWQICWCSLSIFCFYVRRSGSWFLRPRMGAEENAWICKKSCEVVWIFWRVSLIFLKAVMAEGKDHALAVGLTKMSTQAMYVHNQCIVSLLNLSSWFVHFTFIGFSSGIVTVNQNLYSALQDSSYAETFPSQAKLGKEQSSALLVRLRTGTTLCMKSVGIETMVYRQTL